MKQPKVLRKGLFPLKLCSKFHHISNLEDNKLFFRCVHITTETDHAIAIQFAYSTFPVEFRGLASNINVWIWSDISVECRAFPTQYIKFKNFFKRLISLSVKQICCLQPNLVCRCLIIHLCPTPFWGSDLILFDGQTLVHLLSIFRDIGRPSMLQISHPWSCCTFWFLSWIRILTHFPSEIWFEISGLLWPSWVPPIILYSIAFLYHINHNINLFIYHRL